MPSIFMEISFRAAFHKYRALPDEAIDLDLWEISIVTFPLLSGARVRAVKAYAPSRPKASYARARAEREWSAVRGTSGLPVALVRRTLRRVGKACIA
jgi:phage head maturation protease